MKRLKRYLYLLHRWFGVAMCLLFALWFASGIVLMYVDYPSLTEAERVAMLPPLEPKAVAISPEDALNAAALPASSVSGLRLNMLAGRPAYLIEAFGSPFVVFADNGELLGEVSDTHILDSVRHSGFWQPDLSPTLAGSIDLDQWTVSSSLQRHRPLHKVLLNDSRATVLYISSRTGEIVRDTHRSERVWNWMGSVIHWIYPVQLRRHPGLWTEVVIWLSLAGLVCVVTGGLIGFMRLRVRKPYKGKRMSPYHGIDKWHHVLGLWSLIFVATFMFSGLMSMSPWGLFDSTTSYREQASRFTGGSLTSPELPETWPAVGMDQRLKEIRWSQIGSQSYPVLVQEALRTHAALPEGISLESQIMEQLPALHPQASIREVLRLERFDNYYYSTHDRHRPLPALRVIFDDPEATWFHVDLRTGELLGRLTDRGRLARWLYNGLHSLDVQFLLKYRPLWDIVVLLLSVVGLVFSVSAVYIGWRRLGLSLR